MKLLIEINIDDPAFLYGDALESALKTIAREAMEVEKTRERQEVRRDNRIVGHWEIKAR